MESLRTSFHIFTVQFSGSFEPQLRYRFLGRSRRTSRLAMDRESVPPKQGPCSDVHLSSSVLKELVMFLPENALRLF